MKKLRKNNVLLLTVLLLACCLLVFSGVQTSRAALTVYSDVYVEQIELSQIGVTLVENGADVAWRDFIGIHDVEHSRKEASQLWNEHNPGTLLSNMLPEGEEMKIGKIYPEVIQVRNSGEIDEYVRVIIRRWWEDKDGNKLPDMDPDLIGLGLANNGSWILNAAESTDETKVLYYNRLLPCGAVTEPVMDGLKLDESISYTVTETTYVDDEGYTVIETSFDYDGNRFVLEVEADAVQNHNAAAAMRSAWGYVIPGLN